MRTTIALSLTLAAAVAGMMLAGCGTAVDTGGTGMTERRSSAPGSPRAPTSRRCSPAAPFNNVKITATFKNDGTYSVVSFDTSNKELDYAGTYQIMPSSAATSCRSAARRSCRRRRKPRACTRSTRR